MTVEILLAAYNGEKYIREQLDSILQQSYKNWHLTVCDDCSRDNTYNILKEYEKKYPSKIKLTRNEKNSGSAKDNFFSMLKNTKSEYIMFSDQDDIWTKDKVKKTLEVMEKNQKGDTPLLVHSDLKVIDEKGNVISNSMFKMQSLDSSKTAINQMAVQNIITGCTVMINKPLKELLYHTPKSVPVHDWWIGLTAAAFGRIIFIDEPLILYRRHKNNLCGPQDMHSASYLAKRMSKKENAAYMLKLGYDMCEEFSQVYKSRLSQKQYEILSRYGKMKGYNKLKKLKTIVKYRIWKKGLIRKAGQILYM